MAKKIALAAVALVVVLGAAWAGTSWYSGQRVETQIQSDLKLIKHPLIKVVEQKHERGLLTSSGVLILGLDPQCTALFDRATAQQGGDPAAGPNTWRIAYRYEVAHALPLLRGQAGQIKGSVEADAGLKTLLAKAGIPAVVLTHDTRVKFDGSAQSDIEFPAWQITDGKGSTFQWYGMRGTSQSGPGETKRVKVQLDGKGADLVSPMARVTFGQMQIKGDLQYDVDPRLALGTSEGTLSHVSAVNPAGGPPMFEVKGVRIISTSKARADKLLDVEAGFFIAEGGGMGAQFKNASYELAVRGLHAETLLALDDYFNRRSACAQPDPAQHEADQKVMTKLLVQLLTHNPQLEIKRIGAETHMGVFNVSARISARGITEADFAAPDSLKNKFDIEARAEVPAALLQMAPMAENFLVDGLLTLEANSVKTALNYSQGVLALNGKTVDPERFMMAQGAPEPMEPVPALAPAPSPAPRMGPNR